MELLTSNFPPVDSNRARFFDIWERNFKEHDSISIAVGYASNDSLLYLKKLIELNQPKDVNFCLGLPYFEGLPKSQFQAMEAFSNYVMSSSSGEVRFVRSFPFHGKVYFFEKPGGSSVSILGSSNLSNIVPFSGVERRNYEIDIEITDPTFNSNLKHNLNELFFKASIPFLENKHLIQAHQNPSSLLNNRSDVSILRGAEIDLLKSKLVTGEIQIPLKTAPRSNLNAYFGEGRTNAQGFTKPRHWYEVEIIVDIEIQRTNPSYPANQDFWVFTDDGYKFVCRTSGDYGKNFRSRDDLTILGRWLKGRLEASGALVVGQPVTGDVLATYGRDTLTLQKTSTTEIDINSIDMLDVWYLDFHT